MEVGTAPMSQVRFPYAEKATNAADRQAWQLLAEDWTSLARGVEINPRLSAFGPDAN